MNNTITILGTAKEMIKNNYTGKLNKKKGVDDFLIKLGFIAIAGGLAYIFRNQINTTLASAFTKIGTTFTALFNGSVTP